MEELGFPLNKDLDWSETTETVGVDHGFMVWSLKTVRLQRGKIFTIRRSIKSIIEENKEKLWEVKTIVC